MSSSNLAAVVFMLVSKMLLGSPLILTSTPPVGCFCALTLSLAGPGGRDVNISEFVSRIATSKVFVMAKDVKLWGFVIVGKQFSLIFKLLFKPISNFIYREISLMLSFFFFSLVSVVHNWCHAAFS